MMPDALSCCWIPACAGMTALVVFTPCSIPPVFGFVALIKLVDKLIEFRAVDDLVDIVQSHFDAMIGHAALRKIIGADAFRTVAGAHL